VRKTCWLAPRTEGLYPGQRRALELSAKACSASGEGCALQHRIGCFEGLGFGEHLWSPELGELLWTPMNVGATKGPSWGYLKVNFSETLSILAINANKMAPRTT
jgi:hypothetical protein